MDRSSVLQKGDRNIDAADKEFRDKVGKLYGHIGIKHSMRTGGNALVDTVLLHGPFRHAGAAGRINDKCQIVRRTLRPCRLLKRLKAHGFFPAIHRKLHSTAAFPDCEPNALSAHAVRETDPCRADLHHRDACGNVLHAFGQQQGNHILTADSAAFQPGCRPARQLIQTAVVGTSRSVVIDDSRAFREASTGAQDFLQKSDHILSLLLSASTPRIFRTP